MALRNIVTQEDDLLRKKSKDVNNFGERTNILLDDMWETMRNAGGVGLAAPQVGVLRRAIVIDITQDEEEGKSTETTASTVVSEGDSGSLLVDSPTSSEPLSVNSPGGELYELINPEVISSEGESCEKEGCLSVPGVAGFVKRPKHMKVKALDRDGHEVVVEGEGMLAKALSHEIDHLNGVLFTDIAEEIEDAESASEDEVK